MCAIVDADSSGEVAAVNPSDGARAFKEWIADGQCCLVIGGSRLREELGRGFTEPERAKQTTVTEWISGVALAGKLISHDDDEVDARASEIEQSGLCVSNDFHIIALAQLAGARMLYSRDHELHQDFTNSKLVNQPRGKVYPRSMNLAASKQWLARNRHFCS